MITGKFHSHITISPTDKETAQAMARSVHGKITFIDLGPGQTDYMITHHYVTGFHGLNSALDVETLLRRHAENLPGALRLKLEHEILDPRTDPDCIEESIARGVYTEIHLKMNSPHVESGWSASSNALNGSYFLTRRFQKTTLAEMQSEVAKLEGKFSDCKYEVALLDTNPSLDSWWAPAIAPPSTPDNK